MEGRLARARDLLTVKGYDTRSTILACYSAAGFDDELRAVSGAMVIGLEDGTERVRIRPESESLFMLRRVPDRHRRVRRCL